MNIRDAIVAAYPDEEFIFFEDLDEAVLGVETRMGRPPVVAYSRAKALAIFRAEFAKTEGLDPDDAEQAAIEWFEVNVADSYLGEHTPVFIVTRDELEVEGDSFKGFSTPTASA